jgi:phage tail-like protein
MGLSNWMWERVPEMTRERDYALSRPGAPLDEWERPKGPLRELVDVLAHGFDLIKGDIDQFEKLIDVDNCPASLLPFIGDMLGSEFPYDLTVEQQRTYLRSLIRMYRTKGTAWTLRLAAMRVIGSGFDIEVTNESHIAKTFDVVVTAQQGANANQLEQKIRYMVDQYSPAGMIPDVRVAYFFGDVWDATNTSDGYAASVAVSLWKFNVLGHKLNQNARTNDGGVTNLAF